MLSLLFLDSVNQGLAHSAGVVGTPSFSPVTTAPVGHGSSGHQSWSPAGGSDIGKSHGSVPLLPQAPNHLVNSANIHSPARHSQNPTLGSLSLLVPHAAALTSELGQSGYNLSLDLTSTASDIILGTNLLGSAGSVTINVGGSRETFKAGSQVTAGEFVAIQQVLSGGTQGVKLNHAGAATGGTFSLNAVDTPNVTALVIPKSVAALDDFSKNAIISVNGDLTNYGSIYGVTTSGAALSGTISASGITNEPGAIISSSLPSSLVSVVSGVLTNANLNLTLQAATNISNAGSISSSGALYLTAGGAIANLPSSGASASASTIRATNDVFLSSAAGNFANAGLITSTHGNINLTSANAAADININGAGGTFKALSGDINVRDSAYAGNANINMNGGNYLSNNLNLNSGTGAITANIGNVTGAVNSGAGSENVASAAPTLTLGSSKVSGDPTFYNTGNIVLNGDQVVAESLTIIAGGDITATSALTQITTADGTGQGHDITLVAGASITSTGTQFPGASNATVTINQTGAGGGNIDLTGAATGFTISSGSTGTNQNGANVLLAAFSNGAKGGNILLNADSTIDASSTSGNGGNITVIAGAATGTSITLGAVTSNGGVNSTTGNGGNGGNIAISTAQPTLASGPVVYNVNGTLQGTNTITAGATTLASMMIANIQAIGADGNVGGDGGGGADGNSGSWNGTSTTVTPGVAGTAGTAGGNGGHGGIVQLTAGNNITVSGQVLANGGAGGFGGNGGTGGAGGDEDSPNSGGPSAGAGGAGGSGGAGGNGGIGGILQVNAGGSANFGDVITLNGGTAGDGGLGGDAGAGGNGISGGVSGGAGGNAGAGGAGGAGGTGGSLSITAGVANLAGTVTVSAGAGGNGNGGGANGAGGTGADAFATGAAAGSGGNGGGGSAFGGGNGGNGGTGGIISITAPGGIYALGDMTADGGAGGAAGDGQASGSGGFGGNGNTSNLIGASQQVGANGGAGGSAPSGGNAGTAGKGGGGGSISLTASLANNIQVTGMISAIGGDAGAAGNGGGVGTPGDGGGGAGGFSNDGKTSAVGGAGGAAGTAGSVGTGSGASGGNGGIINVSNAILATVGGGIIANGGNGSDGTTGPDATAGGNGGSGGSVDQGAGTKSAIGGAGAAAGTTSAGGKGGSGGNGGIGGNVTLTNIFELQSDITINGGNGGNGANGGFGASNANGGFGGDGTTKGVGGVGGNGGAGSAGGAGGSGGSGGAGGNLQVVSVNIIQSPVGISSIGGIGGDAGTAGGGGAGGTGGDGGAGTSKGGNAGNGGNGGNGGAGGNAGNGGFGGIITLDPSTDITGTTITNTGGTGGAFGSGGLSGVGGFGGNGGSGTAAGKNGTTGTSGTNGSNGTNGTTGSNGANNTNTGNVTIVPIINDLDLSQANVVSYLIGLQSLGVAGGALQQGAGGDAIGGDITLTPSASLTLQNSLSAMNIPTGVTVTWQNLTGSSPLNVNITALSTTSSVIIDGTESFTKAGGSTAIINVSSNQPGPVFSLTTSGTLISDGSLTVSGNGDLSIAGQATATTSLTLTTTAGSNGSVAVSGSTSAGALTTISVDGTGTITSPAGGPIAGPSLSLTSVSGAIGSQLEPLNTNVDQFTVNTTTGDAFIANAPFTTGGATALGASSVGGALSISTSAGDVAITGAVTGKGGLAITTTGTGNITSKTAVALAANNNAIDLTANNIALATSSTINPGGSTVTLAPNGNQTVGVNGSVAEIFVVSANLLSNISNTSLVNIGSSVSTGTLTTYGSFTPGYALAIDNGAAVTMASGSSLIMGSHALNIDATGAVSLQTITGTTALTVLGQSITLGQNITYSGGGSTVALTTTTGSIVQTGGTVAAGLEQLQAVGGNIGGGTPVNVSTPALFANATGTVNISDNQAVVLSKDGGLHNAGTSYTLSAPSIQIGSSGAGNEEQIDASTVVLTATAGAILNGNTSSSIVTGGGSLTLNATGGNIGSASALNGGSINSDAATLAIGGSGQSFVSNVAQTGNLNLSGITGTDITIVAGGQITTTKDFTVSGALTLTTNGLVNANNITGGSVEISGIAGQVLNINNTGSITASAGNIQVDSANDQNVQIGIGNSKTVGSFNVSGANNIVINANVSLPTSTNQIIFTGSQNLNTGASGSTVLNAGFNAGQAVTLNGNPNFATVTGNNTVVVNSNHLNQPNGILISPNLVFGAGGVGTITFVGNLDLGLSKTLTFHGQTLTIIASGNISSSTASTIDLSNSSAAVNSGNGGNLNIIAGYNFSPANSNQNPVTGTFTITGSSLSGGNISLGNVNVLTGSTVKSGNGGNILAVASGPSGATGGTIALGNIDASANVVGGTSTGGSVALIGQGITVGTINTSATTTAGTIAITSAAPSITGTITSTNGNLSGGSFSPTAPIAGNITTGAITAGNATVAMTTGGAGNIQTAATSAGTVNLFAASGTIQSSGTLTANTVNLTVTTGSVGTLLQPLPVNAATINSAGASATQGSVFITDSAANVTVGNVSVGTFNLAGNGQVSLTGSKINANSLTVNEGTGTINITDGTITAATSSAGNGGSINLSASAITSPNANGITFNANGSTGDGGSITVNSTAGVALATGAVNDLSLHAGAGTSAGAKGGIVSVTTAGQLQVTTNSAVDGSIPTSILDINPVVGHNGAGGSISLSANNITWGPSGSGQPTSLNLTANGDGTGKGGSVSVNLTGGATATIGTAAGDFNLTATSGAGGDGGSVSFATTGTLTLPSAGSGLTFEPSGSTGNGGAISLSAKTFTLPASVFVLNADGANGGVGGLGGYISIQQTGTTAAVIGTSAGQFQLNAVGGNNVALPNGSGVSFSTGGTLVVHPTALTVTAAPGTNGENIKLQSNSITSFNYGLATASNKNGVLGTLNVAGNGAGKTNGSISLSNLGGAITNTVIVGPTGIGTFSMTSGGKGNVIVGKAITADLAVDLSAGLGTGSITGSQVVTAPTVNLSTGSGSIGALTLVALNVSALSTGGAVTITDKNAAGTTADITGGSSGILKAFSFTDTLGNVDVTGAVTGGTSLIIKASATKGAGGSISLGGASSLSATGKNGVVTLTAGGATGSGGTITASAGSQINAVKTVTITAAKGSVTVSSIGNVIMPATVAISALNGVTNLAGGGIKASTTVTEKATGTTANSIVTIDGNITVNGTSATTGTVAITDAGSGLVSTGAASTITGNKSVTLTSSKGGITESGSIVGGTVTLTAANTTAGSITVNNLHSTNGAISVKASGANLNVDTGATITTAGTTSKTTTILLEDTNTSTGNVTIGANADIATTAIKGGKGTVDITIGAPPGSPVDNAPAPTGTTYLTPQPGAKPFFYFIGNAPKVVLNSSATSLIQFNSIGGGQVVINNAAKTSGLITINGGTGAQATTITADPPAGFAAPLALQVTPVKSEFISPPSSMAQPISQQGSSSLLSFAPGNLTTIGTGSLSAIETSVDSSAVAESGIVDCNTAAQSTHTLYGFARENCVPQETVFVGKYNQTGEIEAAVIAGADMGISGPKNIEIAGWTHPGVKTLTLRKGNVLVAPEQDTVVETPFGKVQVGAQAVALIMALPGGTAVYNLDDSRKNSVVLTIGQSHISLAPGRHAMVTSHLVQGFEMVNPAESFGYRNVASKKLDGDLQAFTAEFSMMNAIGSIKQLKAMVNCKHPEAKRVSNHLLKTAAIMSQIAGCGDYQAYQHPRMTASALVK
jgi:hypothetical protein